jgi:hypothetical protein
MAENPSLTAQFNPTLLQLITQVFKDLVVIDEDESPTAGQYSDAVFALNAITKTLQATGIHVWTEEEAMLFMQTGVARYIFAGTDPSNTAMACYADDWVQDELPTTYLTGATVLDLPTAPLLGIGDNIGIVLDDPEVLFWTTIEGISGFNVTLAAGLPSSANGGNYVFSYPVASQVMRPLKVPQARLYTYAPGIAGQGTITPMTILSRQEYMDLPNQLQPGTPSQWFYDPRRSQGWLYFWLPPQQQNWGSRFTYYRPIQDWLVPGNTADFPQEWIQPLRWILAKDLGPGFSVPPQKWQIIKDNYAEAMDTVIAWDRESEPVQFGIDWQNR